jgi:hypothetical protein
MKKFMVSKHVLGLLAVAVFILCAQTIFSQKASAAYEAGRILDDGVLLDARSMNPGQVQSFLASRGGQIAGKSFVMNCDAAGQQAKQMYQSIGAPCGHTTSAANIIYYSAQVYGISPKVIMATMQKEQSLITATNPTDRQYSQAMGYACPTSGNCSDSSNFFWQIDNGTWVLRYHFERARGNMNWWNPSSTWTCGTEKNLYKPNLYPGQNVRFYDTNGTHYTTVYIQNSATSSFYCYTPHAYNNPQGLYGRSSYGITGLYYSGSYNFVTFFEAWFGSTRGEIFTRLDRPRWMQIKNNGTYKVDVITQERAGGALSAGQQIRFIDKTLVNGKWYLRTEFNNNDGGLYAIAQDEITDIPYQAITPKWVTFKESGNRSHPASRTSSGDYLERGTSVKVVDQITIDGNIYYRTEFNHNNNQDAGIHSRFITNFMPVALNGPRNFCASTTINKLNPLTGQNVSSTNDGVFMIKKKTLIGGTWYYQTDADNGTSNFLNSNNLSDNCYIPLAGPRSMRLNQNVIRFNPYTNTQYDTLSKDTIIALSTKMFINNQWYFRTSQNTQNNIDAVIPASAFSELP